MSYFAPLIDVLIKIAIIFPLMILAHMLILGIVHLIIIAWRLGWRGHL